MRSPFSLLLLAAAAVAACVAPATGGETPLFNGRDLSGWAGDPGVWSVQGGVIRGETSLLRLALSNTFLIRKGEPVRDFRFRFQVRLRSGNSGVQYRARDLGKWKVAGYQAEISNEPGAAGFLYEERGRKFLAYLGEGVRIDASGARRSYPLLGAKSEYLVWKYYRPGEWNDYLIVAQGPYVAHYVNGFKTIELFDEDTTHRASDGVLALQVHAGLPMTVEFRELYLENL